MSKTLYQYLYQNETLYDLKPTVKAVVTPLVEAKPAPAPAPPPAPSKPLVEVTPVVVTPPPIQPTLPVFVSRHKVLVLVDEKPELSVENGQFLNKILGAIGLSTDTVELLNLNGQKGMDFRPLLSDKKVNQIVSFGVPFLRVNIDVMINRYDPKTAAGVTLLLADSLSVIQADDTQKRALWNNLKALFK